MNGALSVPPWVVVLISGTGAQLLKFLLYGIANRRFSLRSLVTTNGLPSLHAVTFGCLGTIVAMDWGHKSSTFLVCFILGGIILHDSIRLRGSMDRGGQASLLVAQRLPNNGETEILTRLRPLLGDRRHRPLHVLLGMLLGSLSALLWHPALG